MGRTEDLEALREVTWASIDEDEELERQIRALFYFFYDILMRGANCEREILGCSFSQRGLNTMLVVKSRIGDLRQVAYATEKFPTGCVVTFGRQMLEDRVKWHLDKYAKT